jgi:hypothetical protein
MKQLKPRLQVEALEDRTLKSVGHASELLPREAHVSHEQISHVVNATPAAPAHVYVRKETLVGDRQPINFEALAGDDMLAPEGVPDYLFHDARYTGGPAKKSQRVITTMIKRRLAPALQFLNNKQMDSTAYLQQGGEATLLPKLEELRGELQDGEEIVETDSRLEFIV